jgi:hypothetical protein
LNGTLAFSRSARTTTADHGVEIALGSVKPGTYLLRYSVGMAAGSGSIEVW